MKKSWLSEQIKGPKDSLVLMHVQVKVKIQETGRILMSLFLGNLCPHSSTKSGSPNFVKQHQPEL